MTQPPLSMLLRKLEGELKVSLFDRSGHRLAPTATGELFYLRANRGGDGGYGGESGHSHHDHDGGCDGGGDGGGGD